MAAVTSLGLGRFRHTILLSILVYGSSLANTALADVGGDDAALRNLQELPALVRSFSDRGAPPTPLSECHGDCDNDNHCAGDLQCFQR